MNASSLPATSHLNPSGAAADLQPEPVALIVLGAVLRQRRIQADFSVRNVAQAMNCSERTLNRIETGHVLPRTINRALAAFGAHTSEAQVLKRLWHEAQDGLPACADLHDGSAERLAAVVKAATLVRTVASAQLPLAFRIPAYSWALHQAWPPIGSPSFDAAPTPVDPQLSPGGVTVLDEAVLLRGCGDPAVMDAQLEHLAVLVRDGVDLRIRPLACRVAVPAGRISELDAGGRTVYVEAAAHGWLYYSGPAAAELRRALDVVTAHALSGPHALAVVKDARRSHVGDARPVRACAACAANDGRGTA